MNRPPKVGPKNLTLGGHIILAQGTFWLWNRLSDYNIAILWTGDI